MFIYRRKVTFAYFHIHISEVRMLSLPISIGLSLQYLVV